VRHLELPDGVVAGSVRFLRVAQDPALAEAFARFGDATPELVCEVEAVGGTDELVLGRARRTAQSGLALVRQQMLLGSNAKIYLEQVMFELDGTYTWRRGGAGRGGLVAQAQPDTHGLYDGQRWCLAGRPVCRL
jgi:hypothetical protein